MGWSLMHQGSDILQDYCYCKEIFIIITTSSPKISSNCFREWHHHMFHPDQKMTRMITHTVNISGVANWRIVLYWISLQEKVNNIVTPILNSHKARCLTFCFIFPQLKLQWMIGSYNCEFVQYFWINCITAFSSCFITPMTQVSNNNSFQNDQLNKDEQSKWIRISVSLHTKQFNQLNHWDSLIGIQ